MPHLSRYKLSPKHIDELAQKIVSAARTGRSQRETALFFDDLLTQTEKAMLGKRILIAMFLERGYTYAAISNILKVSETTIGAVSERLQKGGDGFRRAIEGLEQEEKIEKILIRVEKMFANIPRIFPSVPGEGRR